MEGYDNVQCIENGQQLEPGHYAAMPYALAQELRRYLGTRPYDEVRSAVEMLGAVHLFVVEGEKNEELPTNSTAPREIMPISEPQEVAAPDADPVDNGPADEPDPVFPA